MGRGKHTAMVMLVRDKGVCVEVGESPHDVYHVHGAPSQVISMAAIQHSVHSLLQTSHHEQTDTATGSHPGVHQARII